jgi:acetyltransferase
VLSPRARLNASFAARLPREGPLALISQSGAIAAGLVEWGHHRGVGFSGVVSLGDAVDVDFGDCLDHFAEDPATRAILLYVEAITDARKFMSAASKAARVKPVFVMKAGRHAEGAKAAATHTGALAGSDEVYAAAFRRAGCLRVMDLDDMFATAATLAVHKRYPGDRLAIVTNGGGLGVLAVDKLAEYGANLAALSPATLAALDAALPKTWSGANPVDIIGDAPASRYEAATAALLADGGVDAMLAMNCPTALTSPTAAANGVIRALEAHRARGGADRPIFAVWMGCDAEVADAFRAAGIASFETESAAMRGAAQLMQVRKARDALLETVPAMPASIVPDHAAADGAIAAALDDGRSWLTPTEVSSLLGAYGISAAPVRLARTPPEAAEAAAPYLDAGSASVVKIQSRDISHKSDVDGVRLGLSTREAVEAAAAEIMARARRLRPDARIEGVTVQPMIHRSHARELIIGVALDPTFGPVALFGHGGTAVEVIADKALALLPLDLAQARALMRGARVSRLLAGYRNVPAADAERIADMLVRVSRLVEDNPEIVGLDLNPVLADDKGVMALDARVQVAPLAAIDRTLASGRRFAIRPYPRQLEQMARLADGRDLLVRPLRPTDADGLMAMLERCTQSDLRLRFLGARNVDHALVARLTQLDYAREMAIVALDPATREILGVVRLHGDANHERGEYAVLVRSDQQERGIGQDLMKRIIAFGRAEGFAEINGEVLAENTRMLAMCRQLGFVVSPGCKGDGISRVSLTLKPGHPA